MRPTLKISKELSLPAEAVTETFAILAKRGAGKTYTSAVMVEEMLKASLPVVVIDPVGVW
jgi:DNA helicase HerA-like ATPase